MAILDTSSIPDPYDVSIRPIAMRYGAIWAGASIVLSLIGFLADMDPNLPNTSTLIKVIFSVVGFGIAGYAIAKAIMEDRDNQLGGFIGFGRCVGMGAMAGLFAGLITCVYNLLYFFVINPGFAAKMQEGMIAKYQEMGLSEEQIETSMKFVAKFSNPWFMSVSAIIATVVIGTIIGLILGIFLKRERPLM